jgi:hypothetical protein
LWCCSYCSSSKTPGRDSAGLRPLYWPRPRFLNAPWRGPSHCALEALRRSVSGANIPTPGGTRTTRYRYNFLRARRIGFYHGSELPSYRTPALRFGPPRCPKPSPARCRAGSCVCVHQQPPNASPARACEFTLAGSLTLSGRGYARLQAWPRTS